MYLPQFEAAVKDGRAGSVMCSYNRLNGPHTCESRTLLERILRRNWGFKGFVLADYGASKRVSTGLKAGLDYEPYPFARLRRRGELHADGGTGRAGRRSDRSGTDRRRRPR